MRVYRFIGILTSTTLLTFIILLIKNTEKDYFDSTQSRELLSRDDISEMCSDNKLIPDKEPIFNNPDFNVGGMSSPFVNLSTAENKGAYNITQFILTGEAKYLTSYVLVKVLPYFAFLAFGFLCFLGLCSHFVTCCCPYLCCKRFDSDSILSCCSPCTSYTNLIFSVLSILACIVGFSFSKDFVSTLKAVNCSILDLYYNILQGQQNQTALPYWIGLKNIDILFNNVSSNLLYISNQFPLLFNNTDFLENDPNEFTSILNNYYDTFKDESLINPNPAPFSRNGIENIVPVYIKSYGPIGINGSDLASIKEEYDSSIMYAVEIIRSLKMTSQNIANNIDLINNEFAYFRSVAKELNKSMNNFTEKYLTPIANVQNEMKNNTLAYFYSFFGFFMLLQILNIAGIVMFGFYKMQRMRYLNHVSWFIIAVMIIFSFIIGASFCIIGVIGSDANIVVKYLLSTKSLLTNEVLKDQQMAFILNICFNTNGDLGNNYLNIQNLNTGMINRIINVTSYINTIESKLKNSSDAINLLTDQYNRMKFDVMYTGDVDDSPNTAKDVLITLESWTNGNKLDGPMYMCNNYTQDQLVQNITKCYSDYTYLSPNSNLNQVSNNKYCLVITELTPINISNRYNNFISCPSNTTDFPNVANGISQYHIYLADYFQQNTKLLNKLLNANSNLSNLYSQTTFRLRELTKNVSNNMIRTQEMFSYVKGQYSVFQTLNCRFLAYDISNFVNNFGTEKLSQFAMKIGMVIIVVSFLNCLTVLFSICMINHNILENDNYNFYSSEPERLEIELKNKEPNQLN